MRGEQVIKRMVAEIKAGSNIEQTVDRYCSCATPELRQKLIYGIRQIVGNDMIVKAMRT